MVKLLLLTPHSHNNTNEQVKRMSKFTRHLRRKAKKKVKKMGFSEVGEQHNGCLFVHLTPDDYLKRKVVTMTGQIKSYKDRKATERELQQYGLT